jgi:hypothetical protein
MASTDGDSEIVNEARTVRLMSIFADTFRSTVPQVFREFGQEKSQQFVDEIKFKIASQLFNHAPLSRAYYEGKLKAGQDPRILIQSSEYIDSFMYEELTHETEGITFRVGVPNTLHSGSGLPMKLLQKFLEFGTSRMPARPHWRPQIVLYKDRAPEMGRELRSIIAHRVAEGMQE